METMTSDVSPAGACAGARHSCRRVSAPLRGQEGEPEEAPSASCPGTVTARRAQEVPGAAGKGGRVPG